MEYPHTDTLTKALAAHLAGAMTQDQLARVALPIVTRIVGSLSNGTDAAYLDEVVQETCIKLFTEVIERADLVNYPSILPMVVSYAKNALRHAYGTDGRYMAVSQVKGNGFGNGGTMRSEDDRTEDEVLQSITGEYQSDAGLIRNADKALALEKLAAYRAVLAAPPSVPLVMAKPAAPCIPRTSAERASQSSRRAEITMIRTELGLGLAQFASLVGATVEQLKHYAKNKGHVTEAAMEKARSLHVNGNVQYTDALARYSNRLMSEIVKEWASRAGVSHDPEALASALKVSKKTVQRWMADNARPTWRTIMAIDALLYRAQRTTGRDLKPHH